MIIKYYKIIFFIIFTKYFMYIQTKELTERTFMDSTLSRFMYRSMRNLTLIAVGQTGYRTRGRFLQEPFPETMRFPCDLNIGRSREIPQSVQRLRPGDIKVIAAIGDSLTAASGASSNSFGDMFIENRGLAWSIGGQWNWRNATTLPNILKEYNPNLIGYSKKDSLTFHYDAQFNLAEIGAVSYDMPFMARRLVERVKLDSRIDFKNDWKMVTLCIGGNDFCTFICAMKDPDSLPAKHRQSTLDALRYLRDNMPRTYVNIVSTPPVDVVVSAPNKPRKCKIMHHLECSCWVGRLFNPTEATRKRLLRLQKEFIRAEEEVARYPEFRGLDEFAVVYQPMTKQFSLKQENGKVDFSLLSFDCFHMSQKGNAWAGTSLWNNLLQPEGTKSSNWASPQKKFLCPTEEHPYIYTYDNDNSVIYNNSLE